MSENMEKIKNNWWKILVIAFLGSLFNAIIHGILPSGESVLPPSVIVQQGLLPIAFIIYGTIYYALLGCTFVLIADKLQGSRVVKGLKYGIFFCILTFIVYLEPLPSTATFSITNMSWMLADGIPYAVLGAILGLFLANNSINVEKNDGKGSNKILILIIPVVFLIGRLISYNVFHIYSAYSTLPVNTLSWVFGLGLGIGILYYLLLRPAFRGNSPLYKALFFGLIFGIYLFLFNFAYALIVNLELATYIDFFIRTGMDVLFASIGVFIYEYLVRD